MGGSILTGPGVRTALMEAGVSALFDAKDWTQDFLHAKQMLSLCNPPFGCDILRYFIRKIHRLEL